MSLEHTHSLGGERLSLCTCGGCANSWWVRSHHEFEPSYCPYCGTHFAYYEDPGGRKFTFGGGEYKGEEEEGDEEE